MAAGATSGWPIQAERLFSGSCRYEVSIAASSIGEVGVQVAQLGEAGDVVGVGVGQHDALDGEVQLADPLQQRAGPLPGVDDGGGPPGGVVHERGVRLEVAQGEDLDANRGLGGG